MTNVKIFYGLLYVKEIAGMLYHIMSECTSHKTDTIRITVRFTIDTEGSGIVRGGTKITWPLRGGGSGPKGHVGGGGSALWAT